MKNADTSPAKKSRFPNRRRKTISVSSTGIAAFSTVVEWYDFTLYLYMATIISKVFFAEGAGLGASGLIATYITFAVGYLMRPIGALVFGHIGDRYGRRFMMLLSMAMMTIAMFLTAALPSHHTIGIWSGILMLVLRLFMAFSVGGEYTGVVAYLAEGSRPERRGLIASFAAASSEVGALLAVFVTAVTATFMSNADLIAWGWRIPFIVGGVMAGLILVLRTNMEESPEFERQQKHDTVPDAPIWDILRNHPGAVARTFAISALGSVTYYVGITYVPTFLNQVSGFDESSSLWFSTVAAIAVIIVTPLFGLLSDIYGRRPVMVGLAIGSAVLPYTMFEIMGGGSYGLIIGGSVLLAILAGGVSAVAASCTAEQFPGEGRLSGLALGVTMATAVFGGLTPVVAQSFVDQGYALAPGAIIAVVAIVVAPILFFMPETAPAKLTAKQKPQS